MEVDNNQLPLIASVRPGQNATRNGLEIANRAPARANGASHDANEAPSGRRLQLGRIDPDALVSRPGTPQLTVEGLLEDWGKSSSRYDLDGSGTVDMKDLLALLSKLGQKPAENAEPHVPDAVASTAPATEPGDVAGVPSDDADTGATDAAPLTVDGLLEAWGESGGMYDLDASGSVDMADLLKLLSDLAADAPADPPSGDAASAAASALGGLDLSAVKPSDATVDLSTVVGTNDSAGAGPMTLEGLLEAWGETGSRYDLDQDGSVNMGDLLKMLAGLSQRNADAAPDNGITVPADNGTTVPADNGTTVPADNGDRAGGGEGFTVQGLVDAWGETGSRFDLDGNGTVNMSSGRTATTVRRPPRAAPRRSRARSTSGSA
jgi:Ca2+-binding EF-hand superfamily protein